MKAFAVAVLTLMVSGCATPEQAASTAETRPEVAKKCDEAITGSNVKRCDRGGVSVMSREELERMQANTPGGVPQTRGGPQ